MYSKKLIYTYLLLFLFLAGCCGVIFFSHKYGYLYRIGPFVATYLAIIGLCSVWISDRKVSRLIRIIQVFSLLIVLAGVYLILLQMKSAYLNAQLNHYGVAVKAIVVDIKREKSRYGSHDYAIIDYSYAGNDYLQRINDDDRAYKYQDSLRLLCSSRDPEIFRVVGHKPALNIKY